MGATSEEVKIDKRTKEYRNSVNLDDSPLTGDASTEYKNGAGDIVLGKATSVHLFRGFDHCPGWGSLLLEDEKSSTSVAYCRKCIWEKA